MKRPAAAGPASLGPGPAKAAKAKPAASPVALVASPQAGNATNAVKAKPAGAVNELWLPSKGEPEHVRRQRLQEIVGILWERVQTKLVQDELALDLEDDRETADTYPRPVPL